MCIILLFVQDPTFVLIHYANIQKSYTIYLSIRIK